MLQKFSPIKKILLPLLFLLNCLVILIPVFGINKIDSLENLLKNNSLADSTKLEILINLEKEYFNYKPEKFGTKIDSIAYLAKQMNDSFGLIKALFYASHFEQKNGNYNKSLEAIFKAIEISELSQNWQQLSLCYKQLSQLMLKNPDNSDKSIHSSSILEYASKSLEYAKKSQFKSVEFGAYIHLVTTQIELGQLNNALKNLNECELIYKNEKKPDNEAQIYNIRGRIFLIQKEYKLAIQNLEYAKLIAEQNSITIMQDLIYHNLGAAYRGIGNFKEAENHFLKSYTISRKRTPDALLPTINSLIGVAVAQNDFEKAFHYLETKQSLKDSLFTIQKTKDYIELQTKYETSKKEQENQHLLQLNQQISSRNKLYLILGCVSLLFAIITVMLYQNLKKAKNGIEELNNQLLFSNQEKDNILRIISHDLKTPSTSFLKMSQAIHSLVENKDYFTLTKIGKQIQQLALQFQNTIHNLIYYSMISQDKLASRIEKVYISDTVAEMKDLFLPICEQENLNLNFDVNENLVINCNRLHFSTIIKNLISNAIKYNKENGKINVLIQQNGASCTIHVENTGQEFSSQMLDDYNHGVFVLSGHSNMESSTGIGLKVVSELVQLYKGKIKFKNSVDLSGGSVEISVPL